MEIKNGFLIAFEGLQGAGKSTIIRHVVQYLNGHGVSPECTEWNSDQLINPLIQTMKEKKYFSPRLFCLMHASDFSSRYDKLIEPALNDGKVVICDRYIYTALTRDTARGIDEQYVKSLYSFAREPDLIFFVDTPLEVACNRKKKDILDKKLTEVYFYNSGMDITGVPLDVSMLVYQAILKNSYKKTFRGKINLVILDGELPIDKICSIAETEIEKRIHSLFN